MNPRVEQKAKELARELLDSEEYRSLVAAREEVEKREAARIMLRDLRNLQAELQRKQMAGEPVSEEELQHFQQRTQLISYNPYVRQLLEAELNFAQLLLAVQAIIDRELGLAEGEAEEGEEKGPAQTDAPGRGDSGRTTVPSSRIITPGSRLWTPS